MIIVLSGRGRERERVEEKKTNDWKKTYISLQGTNLFA